MPRPARRDIVVPGKYYHVYARGNDGRLLFHVAEDYDFYEGLAHELSGGVRVHHFALMPNHVHLLLRPDGGTLSEYMKLLQNRYSKMYCRKYSFRGHLWQGRFKSKLIENDAYLFACGNYIEMNPVRAGLVASPGEWRWSSYRHYAHGCPCGSVDPDPFYLGLGGSPEERQAAYRALIGATRSAG